MTIPESLYECFVSHASVKSEGMVTHPLWQ